jgi:hypothetical protein
MIPQMANMPRWMARILADAHPSQAFSTVMRVGSIRKESFIQTMREAEISSLLGSSMGLDDDERVVRGWQEAFESTVTEYSRWIHSGSPVIQLDDKSMEILQRLPTPRFHALTRMEGEGRTYLFEQTSPEGKIDLLIRCTPQGPVLNVFSQDTEDSESQWHKILSGSWDILRWHSREWANHVLGNERLYGEENAARIEAMICAYFNAVAAIEESREFLRRAPESKKPKRKCGKDRGRSKAPKPFVYWLNPNALDAWVEKTVAASQSSSEGSSPPGERTGTRRLHNVGEHYRWMWVLRSREGEAVSEVGEGRLRKDGSRAVLYRVKRLVEAHARGTDVAPQTLQVKGVSP